MSVVPVASVASFVTLTSGAIVALPLPMFGLPLFVIEPAPAGVRDWLIAAGLLPRTILNHG